MANSDKTRHKQTNFCGDILVLWDISRKNWRKYGRPYPMTMMRIFATLFGLMIIGAILAGAGALWVFDHYGKDLPDYRQLATYEPPVMTRIHAGDGRLLAEFAIEKRVFVPIRVMPRLVVRAFLSAEDKTFYSHPGIDLPGVLNAVFINIKNLGGERRPVGASTITQQVAKNFLLTNEVSVERKVKEAILAIRMEQAFTKDRILELYLNEIYLGQGSYGVAAAALNYFNKSLDSLTVAEAAYLAALPKAPNNYHPIRRTTQAVGRRNWVIGRMLEDGIITAAQAEEAKNSPLIVSDRDPTEYVEADYFAEEVRRDLADRFGENKLYKGGLTVQTTINPLYQDIAIRALRSGLEAYDRRHGWRGPVATLLDEETKQVPINWSTRFAEMEPPAGAGDRKIALVLSLDAKGADIAFRNAAHGRIPLSALKWARAWAEDEKLGPEIRHPKDVLAPGDVVLVAPLTQPKKDKAGKETGEKEIIDGQWSLRQIPEINGSIVALDPHTGRIFAMVGGYDFARSKFNRVVQAKRQPGSAFKPFVYLAALDEGYTPSTLILDAPFVIDQGPGLPKWRPANYTKKFYGPSTMRLGIEKSRNLMTVRLAQAVGMEKIANYAKRFGIDTNMPETLAMALGAHETSLLQLTAGYAMLVNGGKNIVPTLIDRIQDRRGRTIFRHDTRDCPDCQSTQWTGQDVPRVPDPREQVTSPASAYQTVSMLEGVVVRGTGRSIRDLGYPLAGKTGTTNDSIDTWFIGFSPDLAVGVFAGFDQPRSLGRREQGASVAAPIFKAFMKEALEGQPKIPFRIPADIRLVRVNSKTGELARPGEDDVILEAFKPGTVPQGRRQVLRGYTTHVGESPATGTGGLY